MKVVFVVGTKNSGKTTISEFLVKSLTQRGFNVATIKHIHHEFTIDTEGKDTFRMRQAGSKMVVSFSPTEIAILRPPKDLESDFRELEQEIGSEGFDFLVVEGFKVISGGFSGVLKILTCKTAQEVDSLVPAMLPDIDCISGVVAPLLRTNEYKGLPVVRFPDDAEELVRRALAGPSVKP